MILFFRLPLRLKLINKILWLPILATLFFSCESSDLQKGKGLETKKELPFIESEEHFNSILEAAQNRLLIFEFYADWCAPCKALEPILLEIAQKYRGRVEIYKINYDENQTLVERFKVYGIPYVGFVKNKIIVYSLLGLHPKETYIGVIDNYLDE
jgi:thioredoxin-like negative regulator of GroEL